MNKLLSKTFTKGTFDIYSDRPELIDLVQVNQTHSNKIVEYKGECLESIEADGIIFKNSFFEKSFAIKTADCIPVLYLGEESSAIVHAGWRGVKNGILTDTTLIDIKPYLIYIGPSIQCESFEVKDDFNSNFPKSEHFHTFKDKRFFDLQAQAIDQLLSSFKNCQISNSGICTFEDLTYNSYRRDKTNKRNWNIYTNKRLQDE
jgi:YfiH family protein